MSDPWRVNLLRCPRCKKQSVTIIPDMAVLSCTEGGTYQETTRLEKWHCDFTIPLFEKLCHQRENEYNRFVDINEVTA